MRPWPAHITGAGMPARFGETGPTKGGAPWQRKKSFSGAGDPARGQGGSLGEAKEHRYGHLDWRRHDKHKLRSGEGDFSESQNGEIQKSS